MAEYISREKLIEHLTDELEECGQPDASYRPIAYGSILGLRMALSYANTLPTEHVVPLRYAYWDYQNDGSHFCSECGYDALHKYSEAYEYADEMCSTWCPHCGCFMTEIRDNDQNGIGLNEV